MSLTIGATHYLVTLADSRKGSLTNRHAAGKEHFKNDLKCGIALTIPAAGIALGFAKPILTTKIATGIGKEAVKIGKVIADKFPKLGLKNSNFLKNLAKNPTKLGFAGLGLAGLLYIAKVSTNFTYKQGRIDQKYEDAARIESQTKNVVLKQIEECQVNKPEQYRCFC